MRGRASVQGSVREEVHGLLSRGGGGVQAHEVLHCRGALAASPASADAAAVLLR